MCKIEQFPDSKCGSPGGHGIEGILGDQVGPDRRHGVQTARRVMEGYEMERTGVGMPSYLGVLKDHEIDSVVLFIKGLKK